jgi:hypothetical protein
MNAIAIEYLYHQWYQKGIISSRSHEVSKLWKWKLSLDISVYPKIDTNQLKVYSLENVKKTVKVQHSQLFLPIHKYDLQKLSSLTIFEKEIYWEYFFNFVIS